jgi:hypothetical protein
MKEKLGMLFSANMQSFQVSILQKEYLESCNYNILTGEGKNYQRQIELIAFNSFSGNILIRERVSFNGQNFDKVYVLPKDGKPEKYKGQNL